MSDIARDSIEPFAFFAHGLDEQHRAIAPAAKLPGGFEPNGELRQLGREAQLVERTDHIGGNYDSGSDFMQLARLLVDGYVDIRFTQEQGCREPSEPRSDNGDVQRHGDPPQLRSPAAIPNEGRSARKASRLPRRARLAVASATRRTGFFPDDL